MQKLLTMLIIGLFAFGAFAGCVGSEEANEVVAPEENTEEIPEETNETVEEMPVEDVIYTETVEGSIPLVLTGDDQFVTSWVLGVSDGDYKFTLGRNPEKLVVIANYTTTQGEFYLEIDNSEYAEISGSQGSNGQAIVVLDRADLGDNGQFYCTLYGGALYSDGPAVNGEFTITMLSWNTKITDFSKDTAI